jgi:hypothetical protein
MIGLSLAVLASIATVAGVEVTYAQYKVWKAVQPTSGPAAPSSSVERGPDGDTNRNGIKDGSLAGGYYCSSGGEALGDPDC